MKFNRLDLIDRINAEIQRREQYAADRNTKAVANHEQKLREYLERTLPAWKTFTDTLRARMRKNQPVTADDIPAELRTQRGFSGEINVWHDTTPAPYVAQVDALHTLLRLLGATDDAEVSTTTLERMGFRTAELFQARA